MFSIAASLYLSSGVIVKIPQDQVIRAMMAMPVQQMIFVNQDLVLVEHHLTVMMEIPVLMIHVIPIQAV